MRCAQCSAQLRPGQRVCHMCGTPVPSLSPLPVSKKSRPWLKITSALVAVGIGAVLCALALLVVAVWRQRAVPTTGPQLGGGPISEATGTPLSGEAQPVPPTVRWLLFESKRDGNWEIYAVRADGSELANLTNNPAWDCQGAWSPDGAKIAFVSSRGSGGLHLGVMNADGSSPRDLTPDAQFGTCGQCGPHDPFWSPDGQQIATVIETEDGARDLFVVNSDGGPLTNLTGSLEPPVILAGWSPDGSCVGFHAGYEGNRNIYTIRPDGTDLRQLTDFQGDEIFGSWSPDGTRIVFLRTGDLDGDGEWDGSAMWVMNADGNSATQLLEPSSMVGDARWSPDGQRIAFQSLRDNKWEIYVMKSDGSDVTQLTDTGEGMSRLWAWSPDGRQILFIRVQEDTNDDGKIDWGDSPDVWVMNTDGSGQTNVSNHPAADWGPCSKP